MNTTMSYAELKRKVKGGNVYLSILYWHGAEGDQIPQRLRGKRKIMAIRSYGFDVELLTKPGQKSRLDIERSSLCSIENNILTIYNPGCRPLNAEEQDVLDRWHKIESQPAYLEQDRIDAISDGSVNWWKRVAFFHNVDGKDMSYLRSTGADEMHGCRLADNPNDKSKYVIRDKNVRGEPVMRYELIFEEETEIQAYVKKEAPASAAKICRHGCPASYPSCQKRLDEAGTLGEGRMPMIGAETTCPLAKYEIPEQPALTFEDAPSNQVTLEDCVILCANCPHASLINYGDGSFGYERKTEDCEKVCLDCPVKTIEEGIQECAAEAAMS